MSIGQTPVGLQLVLCQIWTRIDLSCCHLLHRHVKHLVQPSSEALERDVVTGTTVRPKRNTTRTHPTVPRVQTPQTRVERVEEGPVREEGVRADLCNRCVTRRAHDEGTESAVGKGQSAH